VIQGVNSAKLSPTIVGTGVQEVGTEATILAIIRRPNMPSNGPRYSKDDIYRRAKEQYAKIKQDVSPGNKGKILAIDIETGEYEIDEDQIQAAERLFARLPDPQVFYFRIGYRAVHSFAGSVPEEDS